MNVARSEKFKARKLPIYFALRNDLTQYFLQLVSEINFHNLSDIEPLFREAFDVKIRSMMRFCRPLRFVTILCIVTDSVKRVIR